MIFDTLEEAIAVAERDRIKYVYRRPDEKSGLFNYWTSTTFQHRPPVWTNPKVGV